MYCIVQKYSNLRGKQKLLALELDFWRQSVRMSRKDKSANHEIREKLGLQNSIWDDINTKQLMWYVHVQRMTDKRQNNKRCRREGERKN